MLLARHRGLAVGVSCVALVVAFVAAIALGSVSIPLRQVVAILAGGHADQPAWRTIVVEFRLPKAITAALAGAGLGVAGLQLQTLFRNPLADPFILGISSGASLGVAFVVLAAGGAAGSTLLAGLGPLADLGVAGGAVVGSALVMAIVLAVARRVRSSVTVLIVGLMVGYLTTAIVSLLVWGAVSERLRAYLVWSFGSFGGVDWPKLRILAPAVAVGIVAALLTIKQLNALLLGEEYAASMGVAVRRARMLTIGAASLLAGVVTAFCGPIAFLGIAVAHLARAVTGTSDHRVLVPACAVLGATIALVASVAASLPGSDRVLPLNAVTSLIGAPVVVVILLRSRRFSRAVVT
ncbi:MAG: iron ABC transporter permease [Actinobacteria bacterium]|nr:MAG: iron ABC transporter permease [Actinomycetota bacterium]